MWETKTGKGKMQEEIKVTIHSKDTQFTLPSQSVTSAGVP